MQQLQEDLLAAVMLKCHDDLTKMAVCWFLILIRKDFIQGVFFMFIFFYSVSLVWWHRYPAQAQQWMDEKPEYTKQTLDLSQILMQMQTEASIANCGASFRTTPLGLNGIQPEWEQQRPQSLFGYVLCMWSHFEWIQWESAVCIAISPSEYDLNPVTIRILMCIWTCSMSHSV